MRLATRAPAKVNLVLKVGPVRPDGFHDIASLMVPLDLADRVGVAIRSDSRITCRCPGRPDLDGPENLAARAARAFQEHLAIRAGCDLVVEKRIPVIAGLGGGSSDAAAVLRCLSRAHGVRDPARLAAAALEVGSDVPFFLGSGAAWVRGRGEALTPSRVPPLDLVLLFPRDPSLAIRAGDAYRWLDEARAGSPAEAAPPKVNARFTTARVENDLEEPCFERHPALREARSRLEDQGARRSIMSGSGPTVFGVFTSREQARRAARSLRRDLGSRWDVHLVRTLSRHPGVTPWRSPRSASSRCTRTSSKRT
ncbi:MAG TPA: 4-(cytidine 5'-diphospho)-2-C-methyl-D-erythritol kinase [Anaeromyxobacteraceae bacterium]|nr:4-(cytidine 5'-diphospho)-2-C-methyl-D-erythritol kinase [Anaeromyxobacteraceae bacterium]